MDESEALNDVILTPLRDKGQSVAAADELDTDSEVRQQLSEVKLQMSDVRQQITELTKQTGHQNSELVQQMSVLSRQVHSMLGTLMLPTKYRQ